MCTLKSAQRKIVLKERTKKLHPPQQNFQNEVLKWKSHSFKPHNPCPSLSAALTTPGMFVISWPWLVYFSGTDTAHVGSGVLRLVKWSRLHNECGQTSWKKYPQLSSNWVDFVKQLSSGNLCNFTTRCVHTSFISLVFEKKQL